MKFTDTEKRWMMDADPRITRQHVFNWEQGGGVSLKFLPVIAKVKNMKMDDLVAELIREGHPPTDEPNGTDSAA